MGKSTLLKILAGLEHADEELLTRRQRLLIAYIPQRSEFDPETSVTDQVERAALASGLRADERLARVQETLGRFGFERHAASGRPEQAAESSSIFNGIDTFR